MIFLNLMNSHRHNITHDFIKTQSSVKIKATNKSEILCNLFMYHFLLNRILHSSYIFVFVYYVFFQLAGAEIALYVYIQKHTLQIKSNSAYDHYKITSFSYFNDFKIFAPFIIKFKYTFDQNII